MNLNFKFNLLNCKSITYYLQWTHHSSTIAEYVSPLNATFFLYITILLPTSSFSRYPLSVLHQSCNLGRSCIQSSKVNEFSLLILVRLYWGYSELNPRRRERDATPEKCSISWSSRLFRQIRYHPQWKSFHRLWLADRIQSHFRFRTNWVCEEGDYPYS